MGLKNAIKTALGIATVALSLNVPSVLGAGQLRSSNLSNGSGFNKEYVDIIQIDGPNGSHPPQASPKLDHYFEDVNSNKFTTLYSGSDISTQRQYNAMLKYDGSPSLFNGTNNYVGYRFVTAFPSNLVFTYKINANSTNRVGDIRKKILEDGGTWGKVYLDDTTNAVNGQVYGTNFVNIAPIETTVKAMTYDEGANEISLGADVRPGTISWPEYTDDLNSGSWTAMTNSPYKKYAAVTAENFGGLERLTWNNLPANPANGSRFYRVGNAVYDSSTTNGLDDGGFSEQSLSLLSSASAPSKTSFKTALLTLSTSPKTSKSLVELK